MNAIANQRGVGLIEVLVALVLLAVGVLGFSLLQLRAIDAAQEASERTAAMNLARDLAERIRINREGFAQYKTAINTKQSADNCVAPSAQTAYLPSCNAGKMAQYDSSEILKKAEATGQSIIIADCIQSKSLSCIYVAWGETKISPKNLDACVTGEGTYQPNSKCLVMEAF